MTSEQIMIGEGYIHTQELKAHSITVSCSHNTHILVQQAVVLQALIPYAVKS